MYFDSFAHFLLVIFKKVFIERKKNDTMGCNNPFCICGKIACDDNDILIHHKIFHKCKIHYEAFEKITKNKEDGDVENVQSYLTHRFKESIMLEKTYFIIIDIIKFNNEYNENYGIDLFKIHNINLEKIIY